MVEFNTRFCHEESILIEKKPYSDDLFVKVAASKEISEKYYNSLTLCVASNIWKKQTSQI